MFILCNARTRKLEQMTYVGHREEKKIRALTCELVQSRGKSLRALLNQKEYLTPCLPSPDDERCGHVQFTRCSAPSGVRASIQARQFQHHHLLEQRCGWHASDSWRGSCVASSSWLRKIASWCIWSAASQLQVANDSRVLRLRLV